MADRKEYHKLRTMEEVRHEQLRIKYEIDRKKDMLEDDFERVEEIFSGEYLLDVLAGKASDLVSGFASRVSSYVRNFSSGFNVFSSLLGTIAKNVHVFRSGRYSDSCPEDYYYGPEEDYPDDYPDDEYRDFLEDQDCVEKQ